MVAYKEMTHHYFVNTVYVYIIFKNKYYLSDNFPQTDIYANNSILIPFALFI